MNQRPILAVALFIAVGSVVLGPTANAADLPTPKDDEVVRVVGQLSDGYLRIFGKAVRYCAEQEKGSGNSIGDVFQKYMANLSAGTKAGLHDVHATDWLVGKDGVFTDEIVAMQIRQGEELAQPIQLAPTEGCQRLSRNFDSASEADFRNRTIESHRQYLEKRHAFCSKDPRPTNCKPSE